MATGVVMCAKISFFSFVAAEKDNSAGAGLQFFLIGGSEALAF